MYVDDVLLDSHLIESAVAIAHSFQQFLMAGGFSSEWCIQVSNEQVFPKSLTKKHHLFGMNWNCESDLFSY